ncbi:MAG TPA: FlgD immunoglobulin-like domain containing protein [Candidatus Eisenbacteria bacterium]|jgi:plastocyanin
MPAFPTRHALQALALLIFPSLASAAGPGSHCASAAHVQAIDGRPGWFRIETAAGRTAARWPAAAPGGGAAPAYVIRALENRWDSDGNPATETDTLVVTAGSTVRWLLVSGLHTLTSGRDSADPDAGNRFDYLLDEQHAWFDSTFTSPDTVEFFCFFHEPGMRGVLIVSGSASVRDGPQPTRLRFTRAPWPNPSLGGATSFAVGVPREQAVRVEVLDAEGRRVALLHDGPLAAGDHPFRWRGASDRGERVRSGLYVVRLRAGEVTAMRTVSVLR